MIDDSNATRGAEQLSPARTKTVTQAGDEAEGVGIDSRYRLIVVAALRSKQLLHGARPRIDADPLKRRNTSIALEEVKRGLVPFTILAKERTPGGDGKGLRPEDRDEHNERGKIRTNLR